MVDLLAFFLILFGLLFYNYGFLILNKYNPKFLIDDQFNKPQAFHENSTYRMGGTIIFLLILYKISFKSLGSTTSIT